MIIRYRVLVTSSPLVLGAAESSTEREIQFDATIRETHDLTAEVTTHRIERGSDIADHVIVGQDRVSFAAVVTNQPMKEPGSNMDGATAQQESGVLKFSREFNRVKSVVDELREIIKQKRLCELRLGLVEYTDMILSHLSAPRTAKDGDSVTFTFDATHVDFVEVKTTAAKSSASQKNHKRAKRGNRGNREPKNPSKERESVLSAARGWLGAS